jgi:mercuric ion binding protein
MFRRISGFAAALTLAVTLATASAFAATKTVTIRVNGMKCGQCSSSVAKVLKATAGVKEVEVSYEKGEAVITYDDEKVNEAKLREAINSTGFKAEE